MAEKTDKPVYFFRFEDVMTNPRKELKNLMKFILGMESTEGTVLEQRIEDVLAMGKEANQTYKPRSGGSNKNLMNYTDEQQQYQYDHNEDLLHFFGYVKDEKNPDNNTPYFDYKGKANPENVRKTNGYKKLNEKAFEKRRQQLK